MSESRSNSEIESALRSLSPRESGIDREQLMFLAGQATVQPLSEERDELPPAQLPRIWRLATCASTAVAVVLAMLHFGSAAPQPRVIEKIVYVDRTAVHQPDENSESSDQIPIVQREEFVEPVDTQFVSSRTLRLRHPAMALNADNLPSPNLEGDADGAVIGFGPSIQDMRNSMRKRPRTQADPSPGESFFGAGRFLFNLRMGIGSEL